MVYYLKNVYCRRGLQWCITVPLKKVNVKEDCSGVLPKERLLKQMLVVMYYYLKNFYCSSGVLLYLKYVTVKEACSCELPKERLL